MHLIKLKVTWKKSIPNDFFEILEYYVSGLYRSKQIINDDLQHEPIKNGVAITLCCPEVDSYKEENSTKYNLKWKSRIELELNCKIEFQYLGIDQYYGENIIPANSDFYILNKLGISSIMDGVTFEQIPFYKIPPTYHDCVCYDDLNWWERNYERVYGLWMNGAVGERWAQNQLQDLDSALSKQGIACCKRIEELTKIPTYYWLFNNRHISLTKDKARKCPGCGGDWHIKENEMTDYYAFKCDNCRLVCELTKNPT